MVDDKKIVISLKKAATLIETIIKMEEEKKYCIDVMQQNLAAIGLLKSAHQMLLEKHLKSCFKKAMAAGSDNTKDRMIEEILKVTKLSQK